MSRTYHIDPDSCGVMNPELVPIETEPGWAHIWGTTPDGTRQPLADYHMPCGTVTGFTQTMPGGTLRHVCRHCAAHIADPREE